jgi:hypothetical protein
MVCLREAEDKTGSKAMAPRDCTQGYAGPDIHERERSHKTLTRLAFYQLCLGACNWERIMKLTEFKPANANEFLINLAILCDMTTTGNRHHTGHVPADMVRSVQHLITRYENHKTEHISAGHGLLP